MKSKSPKAVKVCPWSYDTGKINLAYSGDRHRIILNILNRGTMRAVEWLWQNFSKKEIKETINNSLASEWSEQPLHLWSLVYDVMPLRKTRFAQA